jgi:hypothetical protein
MTIQQTIEIPADRRVMFDLPESVPTGVARVALTFSPPADREKEEIISSTEAMASARKYIKKYKTAFKALAQ